MIHKCDRCAYESRHAYLVKQHVKEVHDRIRDHVCQECGRTFSRLQNCRAHIRAVHLKLKKAPDKTVTQDCVSEQNLMQELQHENRGCDVRPFISTDLQRLKSSHGDNSAGKGLKDNRVTNVPEGRLGDSDTFEEGTDDKVADQCQVQEHPEDTHALLLQDDCQQLQDENNVRPSHSTDHLRLTSHIKSSPRDNSDGKAVKDKVPRVLHRQLGGNRTCEERSDNHLADPGQAQEYPASHVNVKSEGKGHACEQCGTSFDTRKKLSQHVRRVHRKALGFTCDRCPFRTSEKQGGNLIALKTALIDFKFPLDKRCLCPVLNSCQLKCYFICSKANSLRSSHYFPMEMA